MAPLPAEQTGESSAGELQKALPTPFLTKTYQLVDDSSLDDLISWNDDGTTFIVWKPAEFARDLLPKHFKHNNFSSFVRQLNTYGFRKVVPDRWEFVNDCFRRGQKGLLRDIQRRKLPLSPAATSVAASQAATQMAVRSTSSTNSGEEQVISSNSSPGATTVGVTNRGATCTTTPELLEENERLRRENTQLIQELDKLRSLCSNICSLMTNHATVQPERGVTPDGQALDLLPARQSPINSGGIVAAGNEVATMAEEEDMSPRLFGVSIGFKRARSNEEEAEGEEEHQGRHNVQHSGGSGRSDEPLEGGSDHQQDGPLL